MGFGFGSDQLSKRMMSKNPFLLPPEFYKNLFAASAILQKPNQTQNECNKLFNAQNFPRNLLFSCGGEEKEVKERESSPLSSDNFSVLHLSLILMIAIFFLVYASRKYRRDLLGLRSSPKGITSSNTRANPFITRRRRKSRNWKRKLRLRRRLISRTLSPNRQFTHQQIWIRCQCQVLCKAKIQLKVSLHPRRLFSI